MRACVRFLHFCQRKKVRCCLKKMARLSSCCFVLPSLPQVCLALTSDARRLLVVNRVGSSTSFSATSRLVQQSRACNAARGQPVRRNTQPQQDLLLYHLCSKRSHGEAVPLFLCKDVLDHRRSTIRVSTTRSESKTKRGED